MEKQSLRQNFPTKNCSATDVHRTTHFSLRKKLRFHKVCCMKAHPQCGASGQQKLHPISQHMTYISRMTAQLPAVVHTCYFSYQWLQPLQVLPASNHRGMARLSGLKLVSHSVHSCLLTFVLSSLCTFSFFQCSKLNCQLIDFRADTRTVQV